MTYLAKLLNLLVMTILQHSAHSHAINQWIIMNCPNVYKLGKLRGNYCLLCSAVNIPILVCIYKNPNPSLNDGMFCQLLNEQLRRWLNCGSWAVGRYRSLYSTQWRKGFPSFQFRVKPSRNLTVIRLLEDIESQAENWKVITFWSKGQESPPSTALNFAFGMSMHIVWRNVIFVWLFGGENLTSATWWGTSSLKDLEGSFNSWLGAKRDTL